LSWGACNVLRAAAVIVNNTDYRLPINGPIKVIPTYSYIFKAYKSPKGCDCMSTMWVDVVDNVKWQTSWPEDSRLSARLCKLAILLSSRSVGTFGSLKFLLHRDAHSHRLLTACPAVACDWNWQCAMFGCFLLCIES
jgi:hypothetical protein